MTPLMHAVKDNRTTFIDRMIDLGCDVSARNYVSLNPIIQYCYDGAFPWIIPVSSIQQVVSKNVFLYLSLCIHTNIHWVTGQICWIYLQEI